MSRLASPATKSDPPQFGVMDLSLQSGMEGFVSNRRLLIRKFACIDDGCENFAYIDDIGDPR